MASNGGHDIVISPDACRAAPLDGLLTRFLRETCGALNGSEATFWSLSADRGQLDGAANFGPSESIIENAVVPVGQSSIGMVATTEMPIVLGAHERLYAGIDEATGTPTRGMVAAPVRIHGQVVGVLSCINPPQDAMFSGAQIEVLEWKAYLLGALLAYHLPA